MDRWWINGAPGRLVDVTDRGFAYGDGLFETMAVRAGRVRFLDHHLDRLQDGCQRLRLQPPDRTTLAQDLSDAVPDIEHGTLKLLVTRGPGPRGYQLPNAATTTVVWGVAAGAPQRSLPVRIRWCENMASVNPATAGLKTLGRLDQVLARAEWSGDDVAEGLMTSTEGRLIGGTASNVFLVHGTHLHTPSVGRAGIAGVMRRVVIEAARDSGLQVTVADVAPASVQAATEMFMTNALTGIRPVRSLGTQSWPSGAITQLLREKLVTRGVIECAG